MGVATSRRSASRLPWLARAASVLALLAFPSAPLAAQGEARDAGEPAWTTEEQRVVAFALQAEAQRDGDPARWRRLLRGVRSAEAYALVLRAAGRTGDRRLLPVLHEDWKRADRPFAESARVRDAAIVAVALLGDPGLITPLLGRLEAAELALAVAGAGGYPNWAAGEAVYAALSRPDLPPAAQAEVLVRSARWVDHRFAKRALELVADGEAPMVLRRAAAYRLWRAKRAPVQDAGERALLQAGLRSALEAGDPDFLAPLAKAWARTEESGSERISALLKGLGGLPLMQAASQRASAWRIAICEGLARCTPSAEPALAEAALTRLEALLAEGPGAEEAESAWNAVSTFAPLAGEEAEVLARLRERAGRTAVAQRRPLRERLAAERARYALHCRPAARMRALSDRLHGRDPDLAAAAATRCGQDPDLGAAHQTARRLRVHPDLRVRIAYCGGLAARPLAASSGSAAKAVLAAAFGLKELRDPAALRAAIAREDPVVLLYGVQLAERHAGVLSPPLRRALLEAAEARFSRPDLESRQELLKLAARCFEDGGEGVLSRALRYSDRALRVQARELLEARGLRLIAPEAAEATRFAAARGPGADALLLAQRALECHRSELTLHFATGPVVFELHHELAPRAVANMLRLADEGYYQGLSVHRVVSRFVAQGGCPRGDGSGGPGYTLPSEESAAPYERGTIGLPLAGRDTGGCQWFVCTAPAPHLDLRYPVLGRVSEGLERLDALEVGAVIERVSVRR